MRIRALILTALVAVPCALGAQRTPVPRVGRRPTPQPAPLPPQAPGVARDAAYRRLRWSTDAYGLVSGIQVPDPVGGMQTYTTFGTGTHAAYQLDRSFSATIDMTVSALGSPAVTGTAELGTRYSPFTWDQTVRPFADLRASYMYLYDTFGTFAPGSPGQSPMATDAGRYSRGLGGLTGAGLEYSLSNRFAVTTELLAMRNRLTTYRITGPAGVPTGVSYWMSSFRYTLGFKYSPVRTLRSAQTSIR